MNFVLIFQNKFEFTHPSSISFYICGFVSGFISFSTSVLFIFLAFNIIFFRFCYFFYVVVLVCFSEV